jgi:hypothetical protein
MHQTVDGGQSCLPDLKYTSLICEIVLFPYQVFCYNRVPLIVTMLFNTCKEQLRVNFFATVIQYGRKMFKILAIASKECVIIRKKQAEYPKRDCRDLTY